MLGRKCPRAGVRVRHPGGDTGIVTKMTLPSGKSSTCTGPGKSDLVYVKWDSGAVLGVPKASLERTRERGGLGTLGDVWRMNPAGREGPPMAQGRVLVAQPGDYVVNNEPLEPMRLPQYKTPDQLVNRLQDEWANEMRSRVERRGLGDGGDWKAKEAADALLNGRPVHVQRITGDRALVLPAGFRRGLPMEVAVSDLQPLRGLGASYDGRPSTSGPGWRKWHLPGRNSVFFFTSSGLRDGLVWEISIRADAHNSFTVVAEGYPARMAGRVSSAVAYFTAEPKTADQILEAVLKEPSYFVLTEGVEGGKTLRVSLSASQSEALQVWLDEAQGTRPLAGLGWDDTTHAQEFDKARFEAMQSAADAELAMRQGQCKTAGAFIDEAYVEYGFMKGNATTPEQMSTAVNVHKAIQKADRPFEQRCVREEPVSETYERSMSMMRPGLAGDREADGWAQWDRENPRIKPGMWALTRSGIRVWIVSIEGDEAITSRGGVRETYKVDRLTPDD